MPTNAKGLFVIETAWVLWLRHNVLPYRLRTNVRLL